MEKGHQRKDTVGGISHKPPPSPLEGIRADRRQNKRKKKKRKKGGGGGGSHGHTTICTSNPLMYSESVYMDSVRDQIQLNGLQFEKKEEFFEIKILL